MAHCAWHIHDHIVFPVKYRKALLDDEVATVGERVNWQTVERYVQRHGNPYKDLRQLRML